MKSFFFLKATLLLCFFTTCLGCNNESTPSKVEKERAVEVKEEAAEEPEAKLITKSGNVGNIPVYDFDSFEPLLHINNDTTYVVNFWATWCKPCVAELPYFEQLHENYKNQKVKVLLVSLDFSTQIEKKLIPFIEKRNLQPEVLVLDDPNANGWIDKVDPSWSGAIPATVIYQGKKRGFFERSFEKYEDLVEVMEGVVKG